MSDEEIKQIQTQEEALRISYQQILQTPAGKDLLERLTRWQKSDQDTAEAEMDNLTRKGLHLQSASVYRKVKLHLETMSEGVKPTI
jgi:hypothetical protein